MNEVFNPAAFSELLQLLRSHGVTSFKDKNVEILFGPEARYKNPLIDNSNTQTTPTASGEKKDEDLEILLHSTPFAHTVGGKGR